MRHRKVFVLLVSLVTALSLSLVACAKPSPAPTPAPAPKPAPAAPVSPAAKPSPKPAAPTTPAAKPSPAPAPAGAVPAGAQPIKLRFAGSMPINHVLTKGANKLKELVEARSKGVMTIEVYPASQLYKDTDFPDVIPAGTVDLAQGSPGKWAGIAPVVLYTNLVASWEDYDHLFRFVDGPGFDILDREMNKVGTKLLGYGFYGGAWGIVSNKSVKKLEDIKDLRTRATDAAVQAALMALGAKAVVLSSGEAYTALQRGTIDAAVSGASSFVERKWWEVGKYTTFFPKPSSWSGTEFPIFMNLKRWESLPPWAKTILKESAVEADKWTRPIAIKSELDDIATLTKNSAAYLMPESEWERWRAIAQKASKDYYIATAGEAGKAIMAAAETVRKPK